MPTPIPPFREPDRESLAPLLLRRFHLIAPPILFGTAGFAVLHVVLQEPQLPLLLALKLLQALVTAGGLWIAARRPTRRVIVACLLALAVTVNFVTALTGMVIGNIQTNSLLFVATVLATSSFLPWGVRAQTIAVLSGAAAAVAPLLADAPVPEKIWYDLAALAVAFAISIYIAREVERDTLAEYRAQAASRALAESRADFEGVFRASSVLLALFELTDDDFIYAEVNEALAGLVGLTVDTMRGSTGREIGFTDDEIRFWREIIQRCAAEGTAHVPEYCLTLVQPQRWYHLSYNVVRSAPGKPARVTGLAVDITELRQAREALQRMNLDLEAQVRERTALLEGANKDLESFAYSVSHDLRTPLRSIEGFAQVLADDHGAELSPAAGLQLGRIRSASRRMAQLINDMLMLSRASRTEIRREPLDLTLLVRGVAAELRAARPERNAAVEVEAGLVASADPQLLRIVMTNLLGNAWKYTGRCEAARVEVGSEASEEGTVFFVRDNGCGFDMRFVGKLFQPFQRLHAAEEFEGTGVGLATVARIVRRHGGRVWAEGVVDGGCTIRFTLGDGPMFNPS